MYEPYHALYISLSRYTVWMCRGLKNFKRNQKAELLVVLSCVDWGEYHMSYDYRLPLYIRQTVVFEQT